MAEPVRPPDVVVVVTCFNEGAWLKRAVGSVLEQSAGDRIAEIAMVDDGSDAGTSAVLDEVAAWDGRIALHRHHAQGVARNRNLVIRRTRAPLIALLDADDWWRPSKLAEQLALIEADPSVGLVYTGFTLFEEGRPETIRPVRVLDHAGARDLTLAYFRADPPIVPSTILLRRTAFEAVGGFDETIRVFEDTEFFLRLSRVTRFAAAPAQLTFKRNHPASITSRRADLMMHHAFVAFHFARREPRLLPSIAHRLAERARKLGNLEASDGHHAEAVHLYRLALSLRPVSPLTWAALAAQEAGGARLVRALRMAGLWRA